MTKTEILSWIAARPQWRCSRCHTWNWTRTGDWLDRFTTCRCGREENLHDIRA